MSDDFKEESYERHRRVYDNRLPDAEGDSAAWEMPSEGSVDGWRQKRKHELIKPLLESLPGARWITVGDGRFGEEAHYIEQNGGRAVATDISDTLLEVSARNSYISAYSRQNAESLDFSDGEFDLALCKESLHHFPRPMIAVYEMLRVARKAVVLIEPTDLMIGATLRWRAFRSVVDTFRRIMGRQGGHKIFEEAGNYVFCVSRLEMEKVSMALNLPVMAVKGVNDFYMKGLDTEPAAPSSVLFGKVRRRIAMNDFLCRLGLKPHSTTCVVLFRQDPDAQTLDRLKRAGFEVVRFPENPYLKNSV